MALESADMMSPMLKFSKIGSKEMGQYECPMILLHKLGKNTNK